MAEKRRYKKSEITRKKLIDAAIEVFREKGYSKARITDITKKVGLTHAAFYAYFKDKDDLVRSLIENVSQDLGRYAVFSSDAKAIDFDDPKALKKTVSEVFAFYRDNLALHAAFIEGALQDKELRVLLAKINKDLITSVSKQIKEHKKAGKCDNWNPEVMGNLLVLILGYVAVVSELGMLPASREVVIDTTSKLLYAAFNYTK
jgi:AcrR family transcriptional regulator